MEPAGTARTAGEMRARLIARLNDALLRPGMHGGELTLRVLLDDLAWLDGREHEQFRVDATLAAYGARSPRGVAGVFTQMFGERLTEHMAAAAMVYADLAHARGYLAPQRSLTDAEYARLSNDAHRWTASADRTVTDLIDTFGPPSPWRPKYNPLYPVSVAYVSGRPADPLIAFDFWQDTDWECSPPRPRFGPEPILRNIRWRADTVTDGFTFSPAGRTLLAHRQGPGGPGPDRRPR